MRVSVRMEKRALANNRWFSHQWQVQGIEMAGVPQTVVADSLVFEGFDVSLYPDEAEDYFLNAASGDRRTGSGASSRKKVSVTSPRSRKVDRRPWAAISLVRPVCNYLG